MTSSNSSKCVLTVTIAALFSACAYALAGGLIIPALVGLLVWAVLHVGQQVKVDGSTLLKSFLRGILIVKISVIAGLISYAAFESLSVFVFVASAVAFFIGGRKHLLNVRAWPKAPTLLFVPVSAWAILAMLLTGYGVVTGPATSASEQTRSTQKPMPCVEQLSFERDLADLRRTKLSGDEDLSAIIHKWLRENTVKEPTIQNDLRDLQVFTRREESKMLLLIRLPALQDYSIEFMHSAITAVVGDMRKSLGDETDVFVGMVGRRQLCAIAAAPASEPIVGIGVSPIPLWRFYRTESEHRREAVSGNLNEVKTTAHQ